MNINDKRFDSSLYKAQQIQSETRSILDSRHLRSNIESHIKLILEPKPETMKEFSAQTLYDRTIELKNKKEDDVDDLSQFEKEEFFDAESKKLLPKVIEAMKKSARQSAEIPAFFCVENTFLMYCVPTEFDENHKLTSEERKEIEYRLFALVKEYFTQKGFKVKIVETAILGHKIWLDWSEPNDINTEEQLM